MPDLQRAPRPASPRKSTSPATYVAPVLAEDLLLLLFQPESGTIAGENTLYHVLAGAVLVDLALGEHVKTNPNTQVTSVENSPPSDAVLRSAWEYISIKPREAHAILPVIGPTLRAPLLERLIERGDIRLERRRVLGLFNATVLKVGSGRRAHLMEGIREVLVDGATPGPPIAALIALISASGTLSQFDPEIPWSSRVIHRAKKLEQGHWEAGEAAEAVTRTMRAIIISHLISPAATSPRS